MIIRKFPSKAQSFNLKLKTCAKVLSFAFCILNFTFNCYAQENKVEEPVTVNGDTVEYTADNKEVTVTGNAEVIYKGMKLTCEKLTVNTQTKDATAEGNARLDEKNGVIEGAKIIYNLDTKVGTIIDSDFRSNPYFGKFQETNKVSEVEFIGRRGYFTTCNYDTPHYRIKSRKMNFFPGDKIQTKDDIFYLGRAPLFYLPQYSHSLRDPLVHVQLMPGKSKDWGAFLLTAWRYNLTDNISGRIYSDYRARLGIAEGFGTNYTTPEFGKGDFKYYYTQERARRGFEEGIPAEFQRYFIRWRHQATIDEKTNLTSEYFKIVDSKRMLHGSTWNVLKDYFPLEYTKDSLPLSYVLVHRSLGYSTLDILMQKRVNRWYSQDEKLPEIKYTLPNLQIGESPFYFTHNSSYVNFNSKSAVPSESWNDTTSNQAAISNGLSLPTKIAFIHVTPSFSTTQSYNDKSTYGSTLSVSFSPGVDVSTQFYRLFDMKSNFLGLDINKLRHIITPSAGYSYSNSSTMPSTTPRFGGGASVGAASASFGLSNKLQTKRNDQSVDLADLNVTTSYPIRPKSGTKRGSSFSDFLFELKLLPYSWLTINADATYKHTDKYAEGYRNFSNINYDINLNFGEERTIGFGQRRQRKGGNELTYNFNWRFNPKWKFSLYQRHNRGHVAGVKRGLMEEEYSVSRDLHCWTMAFSYNQKKGEGETIWLVFRLKAFPELEFEYNQMYHVPKPGSQSNP